MRLKRFGFAFGLLLIAWSTVLFLLLYNSVAEPPKNSRSTGIDRLERGIRDQFKANSELIEAAQQALERTKSKPQQQRNFEDKFAVLPVLVFACNRVSVARCLDKLLQYRPDPDKFPIIVSQDCDHEETADKIRSYGTQLTLIQQPDQSDVQVPPKEKKFKGYFKIARHYGWALNQMFFNFNFSSAIVVEDDLEIAPDFFEYFQGTRPLLEKDPTLWCVSAWNDNGKEGLVNSDRPDLLYRSDFFPGLGWMLTRTLWMELYAKWPRSYWDDWIREPAQRRGRSCIRPEISRTKTFGKIGVSNGMYFEKHLKFIKLNEEPVPFSKMNLSYLLKENYDKEFIGSVYECPVVDYADLRNDNVSHDGAVRLVYVKLAEYKTLTKKLGLMDDFRGGVPRTAYMGVVTFHYRGRTVHLAPPKGAFKGYEPAWS